MNRNRELIIDFHDHKGKHDHYIQKKVNPDASLNETVACKKYSHRRRDKHESLG